MGQLLVRGLDDAVIEGLRRRAARSGRSVEAESVEAEHRAILEQVLASETESFAEAAARLRARGPRMTEDSADVIRGYRDRDWQEPR